MIDFSGRTAIVAGGGIGRAVSLASTRAGASVTVADRDRGTGTDTAGRIEAQGGEAHCSSPPM